MKTAIYGGSFNPPHRGHRAVAESVLEELSVDRLWIMPTHLPPHKMPAEDSPTDEQRLALCSAGFGDLPNTEISELELRREGVSYTADTIELLRGQGNEDELFLVLGTDMLLCFDGWYRYRYLLEECTLAIVSREDDDRGQIEEKARQLREQDGARIVLLKHLALPMSSSQLRERLPRRLGRELAGDAVYELLIRWRCYGAQPELSWLRERAYAALKPTRIAHVAGCEETAVALSRRWGEDPELAAEAAILHDITKKLDFEEQLALCRQYSLALTDGEESFPPVLHAITAAALAKERYGVNAAVYGAIRWHCTGKPDMTMLEKIVWLADYTEETRDFPGVEDVRDLTETDLDRAMALALEMTLRYILERGETPCPVTQRAMEYYQERTNRG